MNKLAIYIFLLFGLISIISSCGGGGGGGGDGSNTDTGQTVLTNEQIDTFFAGQDQAAQIWEENYALFGESPQTLEKTVEDIFQIQGVIDTGISADNVNIWIEYDSGIMGGLYLLSQDLNEGNLAENNMSVNPNSYDENRYAIKTYNNIETYQQQAANKNMISNKKVLYWLADSGVDIWIEKDKYFNNSECLGFELTTLKDEKCTVDSIKSFTDYGTIIIAAHGGQPTDSDEIGFMTGEKATHESVAKYAYELVPDEEGKRPRQLVMYKGERLVEKYNYYIVLESFFRNKINFKYPNSLIYASACFSLNHTNMAATFLKNGAKFYVGFDGKMCKSHSYISANLFFSHLVTGNYNVTEAFQTITRIADPGKHPCEEAKGTRIGWATEQNKGGENLKYDCKNKDVTGCYIVVRDIDANYRTKYPDGSVSLWSGTHGAGFPKEANAKVRFTGTSLTQTHDHLGNEGNHYTGSITINFDDDFEEVLNFTAQATITRDDWTMTSRLSGKNLILDSTDPYKIFKVSHQETCDKITNMSWSDSYRTHTDTLLPGWSCNLDSEIEVWVFTK